MPASAYPPREGHAVRSITNGIDPHEASHTPVAIDDLEYVIEEIGIRACPTPAVVLQESADR